MAAAGNEAASEAVNHGLRTVDPLKLGRDTYNEHVPRRVNHGLRTVDPLKF